MIGPRLKSARLHARLSQTVLSEMAGISQSFVAQIERGDRTPSQQVVNALAVALKVPVETLLGQGEPAVSDQPVACERPSDPSMAVSGRFASPGLLELMEDRELLSILAVQPDEWMTLSSIQTLWPLKKDAYVQLLMTLRAVRQDRAA